MRERVHSRSISTISGRFIWLLPLLAWFGVTACGEREDPARARLRERLRQEATLSAEELGRFRSEIEKAIADRTFLKEGSQPLDDDERDVVLGMIADPVGVYDEGLGTRDAATCRILNAPGRSSSAEIEAYRRLWIDVETFLPVRFEFAHAFPGYGEYAFDLDSVRRSADR